MQLQVAPQNTSQIKDLEANKQETRHRLTQLKVSN